MNSNDIIDSHVHVWTDDFAAYPLAVGYAAERMRPASFTPQEFLAVALPQGVQRAVLVQMDFYGFDNSFLLDTLARFPETFAGVAQVDERNPDPVGEMLRLMALGIRGVRILPTLRDDPDWLDSSGMATIWRCAAKERMAICPLIEADDLPALARMCRRFPKTPVVIDHAANIGGNGQFRSSDIQMLCELSQFNEVYVKVSAFYYLGKKRPPYEDVVPMITRLIKCFGPQRLMWGSDNPFQLEPPNTYAASLEFIRGLGLTNADDQAWLLGRTAAEVFFS